MSLNAALAMQGQTSGFGGRKAVKGGTSKQFGRKLLNRGSVGKVQRLAFSGKPNIYPTRLYKASLKGHSDTHENPLQRREKTAR
jgi:hypothetical protein